MQDIVDGISSNIEEFGIEKVRPIPVSHADLVRVPESTVELSHEQEITIQQSIGAVPPDENGITAYLTAIQTFERLTTTHNGNLHA